MEDWLNACSNILYPDKKYPKPKYYNKRVPVFISLICENQEELEN